MFEIIPCSRDFRSSINKQLALNALQLWLLENKIVRSLLIILSKLKQASGPKKVWALKKKGITITPLFFYYQYVYVEWCVFCFRRNSVKKKWSLRENENFLVNFELISYNHPHIFNHECDPRPVYLQEERITSIGFFSE